MSQVDMNYMGGVSNPAMGHGVTPDMNSGIAAAPGGFGNGQAASRAPSALPDGASHPSSGVPADPAQQQADPNAPAQPAVSTAMVEFLRGKGFELSTQSDDDLAAAIAQMAVENQELQALRAQQQQPQPQVAQQPAQTAVPTQSIPQNAPAHGELNAAGRKFDQNWLTRCKMTEHGVYEAVHPNFARDAESLNRWVEESRQFSRQFYEDPASVISPILQQEIDKRLAPLQQQISQYQQMAAQQQLENAVFQYPDLTTVDPGNPNIRQMTPKGNVFAEALRSIPDGVMSAADRESFAYHKASQWEQAQQQARPMIRFQPQTPVGMAMQAAQSGQYQQPPAQTYGFRNALQQQALQHANAGLADNMGGGTGTGNIGSALAQNAQYPAGPPNSLDDAMRRAIEQSRAQGLLP